MWLMNTWYVAGFESELSQDFVARKLLGQSLLIYRAASGEISALEDACPHRFLPLSKGKRVGDQMQCGYHGMRFSVEGRCVEVPGQAQIPAQARLRRYPAEVRHGFIWVWMGQPPLADAALIPDLHWHTDPAWAIAPGYHHFEADYRLVNDNLLDLSHESYVHTRTIGNEEEESIANYPAQVSVEGQCLVRAHRDMHNIAPPPFFAMILQSDGPIHRWQTAVNLLPGINMTDAAVYPVNKTPAQAHINHVLHLLTPETATSTHYFWSLVRNYRTQDPALTATIQAALRATFDEDKAVVEEQQRHIASRGGVVPGVAIRLDEAAMRARRLLDLAIRQEQDQPGHCITPAALLSPQTDPALRTTAAA